MFPVLGGFTDASLLLLRLMVGIVFITSGWSHLSNPSQRSKDIGMSKGFTAFLGAAELAGGLGVTFGILTQLAAIGLILVMLGAIQKKVFVWRTGFWGPSGTNVDRDESRDPHNGRRQSFDRQLVAMSALLPEHDLI
jgi:putative oxidoreductase